MPPVRRGGSSQPTEDDTGFDDGQLDPETGERIPRPPNAWILFRKDKLAQIKQDNPERTQMSDASKIISKMWKEAPPEIRAFYESRAEREKAEHARKYPNYRFCPKSKAQKAAEKSKKRDAARSSKAPKHKSRVPHATLDAAVRHASATHHSSTQVSYVAAAILNQGLTAAVACAPEGPSPPLSLASTPVSTPSPFPSSEFEQGSSTTGTSPQNSPGSASGLGLGLGSGPVQHFKFDTRAEANPHAPRRVPPRLPSRPRSRKDLGHGAVPPRPNTEPPAAAAMDAALSPLPWELPPPSRPQSRNPSPNNLLLSEGHDLSYSTEGMFEPVPLASDPGPIDMNYPLQGVSAFEAGDWVSLMESGFGSISPDGIYALPSGLFQGDAPDEINVNMGPGFGLGPHHDELAAAFSSFDFSGVIPPNPQMALAGEDSQQLPFQQQPLFSQQEWNIDDVIHGASDGVPSSAVLAPNTLPASYESAQPASQLPDYMTGIEEEVAQHVAGPSLLNDDSVDFIPLSSLRDDPRYSDLFQIYIERKANLEESSPALPHSEPFYATRNCAEESAAQQSSSERRDQSPVQDSSASASTYVPPSGAANSQFRRVGGAWRPPVAQAPESVPQTPVYTRVPSWSSVASA